MGEWVVREKSPNVKIRCLVARFVADERGATAIEYALVAAIMALVSLAFSDIFDALSEGYMTPTHDALSGI